MTDSNSGRNCTKCGIWQPWTEFRPRLDRPIGYHSHCKSCERKASNDRVRAWGKINHGTENYRKRKREAQRRFMANHPEYQKGRWRELKNQIFSHYGNECACCGSTKRLSVDHVNGGGNEHRIELFGKKNSSGMRFYLWLIRENFPPGYQVLCLPCNASKSDGPLCRLDHTLIAPDSRPRKRKENYAGHPHQAIEQSRVIEQRRLVCEDCGLVMSRWQTKGLVERLRLLHFIIPGVRA